MYMFDMNLRLILWPIVAPIDIKHVHSSVSYQQASFQIYDRCGEELRSGYGPLGLYSIKPNTHQAILNHADCIFL